MNAYGRPSMYHRTLDDAIAAKNPSSAADFNELLVASALASVDCCDFAGKIPKPHKFAELKELLHQQKNCTEHGARRDLSKRIQKETRQALRAFHCV